MSSASAPGTWAPSTSTGTPRARQAAVIAATGSVNAVSDETWSITASRVRGVSTRSTASTYAAVASPDTGNGVAATTTRAPAPRAMNPAALSTAP